MSPRRYLLAVAALAGGALLASCTEPTAQRVEAAGTPPRPAFSASLVECPATVADSADTVIGLLGGTLGLAGDVLRIPAGVLTLPTEFRMVVPASRYMEVQLSAVGLTHYLFRSPVTLTIDYSRCPDEVLQRGPLTVYYIDEVTKVPLQDMGGVDDRAHKRITFQTDHFSGYAIAN